MFGPAVMVISCRPVAQSIAVRLRPPEVVITVPSTVEVTYELQKPAVRLVRLQETEIMPVPGAVKVSAKVLP